MISFNIPNNVPALTDLRDQAESMSSQLRGFISSMRESLIREAINNHLGVDDWTVEEVMPRLSMVINDFHGMRTIVMDGHPIATIGQVNLVTESGKTFIRLEQSVKALSRPKVTDGD